MKYGRRLAAAAIALSATFSLVACGESSDETGDSADAAAEGPGFEAGAKLSESEATKLIDTAADSMSTIHVEMGVEAVEDGASVSASSVGDYQREPVVSQSKLTVDEAEGQTVMEIITIGETTYVRMDDEKEWMKDDGMFSGLVSALVPSPYTLFEDLSGEVADDTITYVGQEEVDGADLAHYAFVVDEDVTGEGDGTLDGWFDADGRPIRMTMAMGKDNKIEMDFSKHGEELTVTEPKAEELMEGL
ncbi:hypothetical protein G5C66_18705 [Nocardioides sp. KC13]|uniref:LppX_LprAFG lipoprotein n=1 Tax=Nocardioides turkmenicus TaxID=2711220 RepID=A0A6M1RAU0_9ACTN|nr:hypothetical protein [Nocardioides sp. KC13]NGN94758.1 hypothetical protein [Nocardioides sp. KC13]